MHCADLNSLRMAEPSDEEVILMPKNLRPAPKLTIIGLHDSLDGGVQADTIFLTGTGSGHLIPMFLNIFHNKLLMQGRKKANEQIT